MPSVEAYTFDLATTLDYVPTYNVCLRKPVYFALFNDFLNHSAL